MMALVRGVIAASIFEASMLQVSGSMSTHTGTPPSSTMVSAVAAKVNGVVMTSSPGFRSSAIIAISSASVPLDDGDAVLRAGVGGERRLELLDLGAHDVLAVVQHLLHAHGDLVAQRGVLGLQVDEFDLRLRREGSVHGLGLSDQRQHAAVEPVAVAAVRAGDLGVALRAAARGARRSGSSSRSGARARPPPARSRARPSAPRRRRRRRRGGRR